MLKRTEADTPISLQDSEGTFESGGAASTRTLRVGVIGAGVFGGHHATKFSSMEGARLVGVFDPRRASAEALVSGSVRAKRSTASTNSPRPAMRW